MSTFVNALSSTGRDTRQDQPLRRCAPPSVPKRTRRPVASSLEEEVCRPPPRMPRRLSMPSSRMPPKRRHRLCAPRARPCGCERVRRSRALRKSASRRSRWPRTPRRSGHRPGRWHAPPLVRRQAALGTRASPAPLVRGGEEGQHEDVAVPEHMPAACGTKADREPDRRLVAIACRRHQMEESETNGLLQLVIAFDHDVAACHRLAQPPCEREGAARPACAASNQRRRATSGSPSYAPRRSGCRSRRSAATGLTRTPPP